MRQNLRGKETAFADDYGNVDFAVRVNLAQAHCYVVVVRLVHGVELGGIVDGDDGDAATVFEVDDFGSGHFGSAELMLLVKG